MLPRKGRLQAGSDYQRVYRKGRSYKEDTVILQALIRKGEAAMAVPHPRIGFIVSRKQGKAAVRNRIRRRIQEAVRMRMDIISLQPVDLIFIGRASMYLSSWNEVQSTIDHLLIRAGLILYQEQPES